MKKRPDLAKQRWMAWALVSARAYYRSMPAAEAATEAMHYTLSCADRGDIACGKATQRRAMREWAFWIVELTQQLEVPQ
jgi:hypothetical protein